MADIVETVGPMLKDRCGCLAIYATGAVQYGIGRMFQALNEFTKYKVKIGVFRDKAEAAAWLSEQ